MGKSTRAVISACRRRNSFAVCFWSSFHPASRPKMRQTGAVVVGGRSTCLKRRWTLTLIFYNRDAASGYTVSELYY